MQALCLPTGFLHVHIQKQANLIKKKKRLMYFEMLLFWFIDQCVVMVLNPIWNQHKGRIPWSRAWLCSCGGWLLDALQTFSKEDVNKVVCVDLFGHPSFWKHWKVSYSVWSSLKKLFFFFPYGPLFLIHPWRFVGLPSRVQTPPGRGKIQCIVWSPQPKHRDWWSLMSLLHFSIYILSEETETLAILN